MQRFKAKLRDRFRRGRGQSLNRVITGLGPMLRGWVNYYQLSDVEGVFDQLDQWLRRRLKGHHLAVVVTEVSQLGFNGENRLAQHLSWLEA